MMRLRIIIPYFLLIASMTGFAQERQDTLKAISVVSTRSSRTIERIPTRIEFVATEEVDEKINMRPGDIRVMMSESTGITTQQTSAISGNSAIRIQGLDGRYTLILKDGMPAFPGAASGLGLLQTPPLDLKQVEIIKGSTSTLYGGGAIAGLVNLVTKTPEDGNELSFLLNGTSAGGFDASGFASHKFKKTGVTLLTTYNHNQAYDPSGYGFTAIPAFDRIVVNPKLFLNLSDATKLSLGLNSMFENRLGGDIEYVKGRGDETHRYFERNKTALIASQFALSHSFSETVSLETKNSITSYDRGITLPDYEFDGRQVTSFSEINLKQKGEIMDWVYGLNLWTDKFTTYSNSVYGAFIQNDWDVSRWLSVETGLRGDYVQSYGTEILPRISFLFKPVTRFSSRLGGGIGYKVPTIFTEDTERIQFRDLQPLNSDNRIEHSYGLNWDFNYSTRILGGAVSFSVNQLFFFTAVTNPLLLKEDGGKPALKNIQGYLDTKGGETNVKFGWKDFHLYLGYTLTDAHTKDSGRLTESLLTSRHRINAILMYEKEDFWRIGLESYYYSPQLLSDGSHSKPYLICGFMAEKFWEHLSLFVNFENFTDSRQTRFGSIYSGSVSNPVFSEIYAPLDGFVMNGGVKIRF
ncbi:MAG: TonB-dependent receptor [Bacteroidales bacterium]|nr:TonB-dependent receptor [Bacteroidales bacterium]